MSEYAERDIMELDELGGHYCRHVNAMTAEGLHSKSDIAAELGYRDWRIANLEAQLAELEADKKTLLDMASTQATKINELEEKLIDLGAKSLSQRNEIATLEAQVKRYADLISKHNQECNNLCDPAACGYLAYGRQCPQCPKDYKIDDTRAIWEPPEEAGDE